MANNFTDDLSSLHRVLDARQATTAGHYLTVQHVQRAFFVQGRDSHGIR